jgi:hypothetical protein
MNTLITDVSPARAALEAAEAEHTRLVGIAAGASNRPGEHDRWADVRMAGMVVHQARAALRAVEEQ